MRPRAKPCRHCPTAHYPPDPGALDTRAMVLSGEMPPHEMLFQCGWTPGRICRGVFDEMVALMAAGPSKTAPSSEVSASKELK